MSKFKLRGLGVLRFVCFLPLELRFRIYIYITDQCLWETPERPNYPKLETKVGIWQCGLGILVIMIVKIVTWRAEGSKRSRDIKPVKPNPVTQLLVCWNFLGSGYFNMQWMTFWSFSYNSDSGFCILVICFQIDSSSVNLNIKMYCRTKFTYDWI